jgi:hypothetical protein
MLNYVELGAVTHATANGTLPLTVSMITAIGETLHSLRARSVASGRPIYRPVVITTLVGDHHLDLGVRAENVEVTALPHGIAEIAATEPIISMVADYRQRLAATAVRLAIYGLAASGRVAVAFDVTDLRHLRDYLDHAEHHWQEAVTRTDSDEHPLPVAASPWFSTPITAQLATDGGPGSARRAGTELGRVQQYRRWLDRLLTLSQDSTERRHRP